jgi:2'-5' RNA ligase
MDQSATHSMYFLALLCTKEIDKKVYQYKCWMRDHFGCMVAMKAPAHITLIPPFWLLHESENKLIETLQYFTSHTKPITIELNHFSHFSNRVIFIAVNENHELGKMRKQTEDHFIKEFHEIIKPDDRPFHPHVTIANRDIKPAAFIKAWQHFSKEHFHDEFQNQTVSLLKLSPGKWNVISENIW